MPNRRIVPVYLWFVVAFVSLPITILSLLLSRVSQPAWAEVNVPSVRYEASSNTIMIGSNYNRANPNEAEFVNRPSAPNAPKQRINVQQVVEALNMLGVTDRLQHLGNGVWLLKANMEIKQNTRFEVVNTELNELRLDSTPVVTGVASPQNFIKIEIDGGTMELNGVLLHSWNTRKETVDTEIADGRSYVAATHGARLDVLNAEVSYLGWAGGEFTGISWRLLARSSDPTSGPVGTVRNSRFHHNYYGLYIKDSSKMSVQFNQMHDNTLYGILVSDAMSLTLSNNEFYNNRGHGILLSRQATRNRLSNNRSHHNRWSGIALYRGSDENEVLSNESYGNGRHGVTIYQSSRNRVAQNFLDDNLIYGLAINADYDPDDLFDGLAIDNVVENNHITASQLGICVRGRADRNELRGNLILDHLFSGMVIQTGGNQIISNTVSKNEWGINVQGGPPVIYPPGFLTVTPAIDLPGHANQIIGNLIEENQNGIIIQQGSANIVGQNQANYLLGNSQHGLYLWRSDDTLVAGNVISGNQETGVAVVDGGLRNRITRNSISNNKKLGIFLKQANNNLAAPKLLRLEAGSIIGTAFANSRIEIYSDFALPTPAQGFEFQGAVNSDTTGSWNFLLPETVRIGEDRITALVIDPQGNTSSFSAPLIAPFITGSALFSSPLTLSPTLTLPFGEEIVMSHDIIPPFWDFDVRLRRDQSSRSDEREEGRGLMGQTVRGEQLELQDCTDDTPDLKNPDDSIYGDPYRVRRLFLPMIYR